MTPAKMAVVYHAGCMDGAASAAAAYYLSSSAIDFFALPPGASFGGRDGNPYNLIMVLDMTLPKDNIVDLMEAGSTVQIIDHHVTNLEETRWYKHYQYWPDNSGCVATWKTMTKSSVPKSLLYIEDRDLWNWELKYSKELNAYIQVQNRDIPSLSKFLFGEFKPNKESVMKGLEILKSNESIVRQQALASVTTNRGVFVNATTLQSEVGHLLLDREGMDSSVAVVYGYLQFDRVKGSLRSGPNGPDVSRVAARQGGGGHKHAAGMTMGVQEFNNFVIDFSEGKC